MGKKNEVAPLSSTSPSGKEEDLPATYPYEDSTINNQEYNIRK